MVKVHSWRGAAWVLLMGVCLAFAARAANPITKAQAIQKGRDVGQHAINTTQVNEALRASAVPPPPPPRDCVAPLAATQSHFGGGSGNLLAAAGPLMAAAPGGTSPECTAIAYMQGKSVTPNPVSINPGDPMVAQAKAVQNNPNANLAGIGGIFVDRPPAAACVPGSVVVGGDDSTEQCYEYAELVSGTCPRKVDLEIERWWDYQCEKTVGGTNNATCDKTWDVEVQSSNGSCVEGEVLASLYLPFVLQPNGLYRGGGELELICRNANAGTNNFTFRFRSQWEGWATSATPDLSAVSWGPEMTSSDNFTLIASYTGLGWNIRAAAPNCQPDGSCVATIYRTDYDFDPFIDIHGLNYTSLKPKYVITKDELVSTCGLFEATTTCSVAGSVCIDGVNETRNINGLNVTKECWKTQYTYQCSGAGVGGTCGALEAEPLCGQLTAGTCTQWSLDGACLSRTVDYRCKKNMGPPQGVTLKGSGYNIIKDVVNSDACAGYQVNPNCTKLSSTCVDTGDKWIDGFKFTKQCWKWEDNYSCAQHEGAHTCEALQGQGCTAIPGSKACTSLLPNGSCGVYSTMYRCGSPTQTLPTGSTCDTTPYCLNGICYDQARPGDPDFGKSVAMMEVGRQAGVYLDQDKLTVFNGVGSQCRRKLFGANNCCKPDSGGGTDWSNQAGMAATKFGIKYIGSYNVYDMLFAGETDFIVQAAFGMGDFNTGTTANVYGFQFEIINGNINFVGFDPWSFALSVAIAIVVNELTSCPDSDKLTATRRGQGICGHIGDFCAKKVLGACYTKKESYCCFNSKLAKAITMQGKPQLGKSLGDARNPDCSGLTPEEIGMLDFSRIDLSEFIQDLVSNPINSATATGAVVARLDGYAPVAPNYAAAPSVSTDYSKPPERPPAPPAPPDPSATAVFSPDPVRHGQNFVLTTSTTNGDLLNYDCTGFMPMSGTLDVGNAKKKVFVAPDAGFGRTDCLITVGNSASEITTQVSFTVLPPAPTVSASFTPTSVYPGSQYQLNYTVSNADSLTYICSGAVNSSGSLEVGSTVAGPWAASSDLGVTTCTLTARNTATGETGTRAVAFAVVERTPSISAAFSASPIAVGEHANLVTSIQSAASASYACTGAFVASGSLALPNDSISFSATLSNVGTTVCTITALSSTGSPFSATTTLVTKP